MIDWTKLTAPFPAEDIEWRPGATTKDRKKALALAYLTARAVQNRLDEVFTPGGWKNEFRAGPEGGVLCRIYFKNDEGEWVWREDGADNTEIEAVKGGLSSALKRAASALGIGRFLYDLPPIWCALDERGRFAEPPRIPSQFLPESTPKRSNGRSRQRSPEPAAPSVSADVIPSGELRAFYHEHGGSMEPDDFAAVLDTVRVDGEVPASAWAAIKKAVGA